MTTTTEQLANAKGALSRFRKGAERGMRVLVGGGLGVATGALYAGLNVYTDQTDENGNKIDPEFMGVPAPVLGTVLSGLVAVTSKSESMQTSFTAVCTASAAIASQEFFKKKFQEWKDDKDGGGARGVRQLGAATMGAMQRLNGKAAQAGYTHPAGQAVEVSRG